MKQPTHPRPAGGPDFASLSQRLAADAQHPRDLDTAQRPATDFDGDHNTVSAPFEPEDEGDANSEHVETEDGNGAAFDPGPPAPNSFVSTTTIGERTATTLEAYSASTIANIRELRGKLDQLETFFIDDASQVKERISAHMSNGQRVVRILAGINDEIRAIEADRDDMLRLQARGNNR